MSRLAAIADSPRAHALLALVTLSVVGGPFVFGRGIDVPDDFLYSVVSTWEWLRYAVLHGENPFFLPGRMGGVALHTEANQMGPIYPAMWPALLLPVRFALPLAFLGHAVGALFATRWLARVWGASRAAATAAALVFVTGPFGLALFIEAPADAIPLILWFPVVLACHRKVELSEGRGRIAWAVWGGFALAALLTGTHIRHAGGFCGALGLWFLLRWRTMPWSLLLTAIGLWAGASGIVPALLEFRASQGADAEIAGLAVPPLQTLRWSFAASWVAPKPFVTAREFGLGAILGPAFAWGVAAAWSARRDPSGATDDPTSHHDPPAPIDRPGVTDPVAPVDRPGVTDPAGHQDPNAHRALVLYVAALLVCAAGLPVVRVLLTPLTLLAHPVLILYYALAMAPAAVIAAWGLDRLARMDRSELRASLWGAPGLLLGVMVGAIVLRLTPVGWPTFGSPGEWTHWVIGLVQAGGIVAAAAFVLLRGPKKQRMGALLLLLTVDLVVLGLRTHLAVPSTPLNLAARADVDESLSVGYLHANELAVLLEDGLESAQTLSHVLTEADVRYDDVAQGGEVEDILTEAPEVQARLLDRRWPVHAGSGRGWRSLSGRTKLAPPRAAAMLVPLARVLNGLPPFGQDDADDIDPWDDRAVAERAEATFGSPEGLGARTMALFGVPLAVDETGQAWPTSAPAPRCYSPAAVEVEPSEPRRVRRLLEAPIDVERPALVEAPIDAELLTLVEAPIDAEGLPRAPSPTSLTPARVVCDEDGLVIDVDAEGPSLIVLRERHHPGWRASSRDGPLQTQPVNQVHMGVLVPAGQHRVTWRFRPMGLGWSLGLSLLGWVLGGALLLKARPAPPPAP